MSENRGTSRKNVLYRIGMIVGVALIIFAIAYPVPDKHVNLSYYGDREWSKDEGEEYVGGDAYNYEIEASLKAGYVSGLFAMKSITFVGGVLLLFLSAYASIRQSCMEEQTHQLLMALQLCAEQREKPSTSSEPQPGRGGTYIGGNATNL